MDRAWSTLHEMLEEILEQNALGKPSRRASQQFNAFVYILLIF